MAAAPIPAKINDFLDARSGESFSVFTIAAHIGEKQKSVANVLARLANERKLRKRERGFYETNKKSPGITPGHLMPFELPGTDPLTRINPNPEERGNHETKRISSHGSGDPDTRCDLHRDLVINPNPALTTGREEFYRNARKNTGRSQEVSGEIR